MASRSTSVAREPVDLPHARALLGPDAALEDDPRDRVLLDGARGDRAGAGVVLDRVALEGRRADEIQRVGALGRAQDVGGDELVARDGVDQRGQLAVELGGIAQQQRGPDAGLHQQLRRRASRPCPWGW